MDLSYDQFMIMFYCGLVGSVLFLIVTVILLFVLKIPAVIGDLSGSTQRKAILEIRNNNGKIKSVKTSSVNSSKIRITEKMYSQSSKKVEQTDKIIPNVTTARLKNVKSVNNSANVSEETQILQVESNETSVLETNDVTSFSNFQGENGTVIDQNGNYTGQTTVLDNETQVLVQSETENMVSFAIRTEITLFESTEIIV